MYVLGFPSSGSRSSSSAEQCSSNVALPVGSSLMPAENIVIHISDSEYDEDVSQCQVQLHRDTGVQVVVASITGTEVAMSGEIGESQYLFSDPDVRGSVDSRAPATANVATNCTEVAMTGESHYTFSNPDVQSSVDGTAQATTNVSINSTVIGWCGGGYK